MLSFNAFAERQIPTVYKLTGDLNLSENAQKHNYYKLTMNIGVAQIYSGCVDKGSYDSAYEALAFQLANGVFTSPLPAQLTKGFDGQKSLPIDIKLGYSTSSTCEVGSTITLLSTTIMVPNPHFQSSNPPVPLIPDDETITYKKLKTTNAPTNNTFLKYDNDKLVWAAVEGGTGGVTYYGSSTIDIDGTYKITVRPNSIDKSHLVDFNVVSSKIGTYAVTTSKIANDAVTTNKIADKAITPIKLATTNSPAGNQNKFLKLNDEGKLMWANVSQGPPTTPITYFGSDTIFIDSSNRIHVEFLSIGNEHIKNKAVDRHKMNIYAPDGQCPDDNALIVYNKREDRLEWSKTIPCNCYKVNINTIPIWGDDFHTRHNDIMFINNSEGRCVTDGDEVKLNIYGDAKGWKFTHWSFNDSSIDECNERECIFNMPDNNVTAIAHFEHLELPSITGVNAPNKNIQLLPVVGYYGDSSDYDYYMDMLSPAFNLDHGIPVIPCKGRTNTQFTITNGALWPYNYPEYPETDSSFTNGKFNTQRIIDWHNDCDNRCEYPDQSSQEPICNGEFDLNYYAAKICADIDDFGYDDWYLPSYNEYLDLKEQLDTVSKFKDNVIPGDYLNFNDPLVNSPLIRDILLYGGDSISSTEFFDSIHSTKGFYYKPQDSLHQYSDVDYIFCIRSD